jgi:hypothetical protein
MAYDVLAFKFQQEGNILKTFIHHGGGPHHLNGGIILVAFLAERVKHITSFAYRRCVIFNLKPASIPILIIGHVRVRVRE